MKPSGERNEAGGSGYIRRRTKASGQVVYEARLCNECLGTRETEREAAELIEQAKAARHD